MIKHTRYRAKTPQKKRIDPLFLTVVAMLILVPVINACSTTPRPKVTKTQIDASNIETNNLQLPSGYEWSGKEPIEYDDDDDDRNTSSFQQGATSSFRADKNAPTSTRLEAIEDQLSLLRNDFNELYPSMRRLMAIEQDMQELIMELKSLTTDVATQAPAPITAPVQQNNQIASMNKEQVMRANEVQNLAQQSTTPAAMPEQKPVTDITKPPSLDFNIPESNVTPAVPPQKQVQAPVLAEAATQVPAQPAVTNVTTATVTGTRIGIHSDIVRVVLDYTNGSAVSFDKSMNGNIFELFLPNTAYNGRKSWQSEFVPMVTSYTAQQNGSDTTIKFNLESGTSLKSAFVIPPKTATQNARLVIDFAQ